MFGVVAFLPLLSLCLGASVNYDDSKIVTLETYNVDPESVSVSGISSGGTFTSNIFMAHSSFLKGAGIFAGTPYGCGGAPGFCRNVTAMVEYAHQQAEAGLIDPIENVVNKPVYAFVGMNDGGWSNGARVEEFYETIGADITTNFTSPCGHGVPSLDSGVECERTWLPGVNNCAWSGAYHVMEHIYGGLAEPKAHQPQLGEFMEFDQTEFTRFELLHAFADTGYVYIPTGCRDKTSQCRLHVSIHGCFILSWLIGDKFAINTGHNEVGELNDIIILHPQLTSSFIPPNVFGCWSRGADADTKDNVDIRVVMKMVHRVLGL